MTRNNAYNTLVCQEFAPEFGRDLVFQLGSGREDDAPQSVHFTIGGRALMGSAMDFDTAARRLDHGWAITRSPLSEKFDFEAWRASRPPQTEMLFWIEPGGGLVASEAREGPVPGDGAVLFASGPAPARKEAAPAPEPAAP